MTVQRDLRGLLVAGAAAAVLSLAYLIAVGRALTPAAYADFAAAVAIIYLLGTLASPIGPTFAHFAARYKAEGRRGVGALWTGGRTRLLGVVSIAAVVLFAASGALSSLLHFESPAVLALAMLASLVMPFVLLDRGILQGESRFVPYNWNTLLEAVLRLAAGLAALALLPRNALYATGAYVVAIVAALIHGELLVARRGEAPLDQNEWRSIGAHLFGTFAIIGTYSVFQNLDVLVVKRFLSTETAGLYGAVASLARAFGIVAWPLNAYLIPRLATAMSRGEPAWPIISRIGAAYLAIVVPLLAGCAFASGHIVELVFGKAFLPAGRMLFVVMAAGALTTFNLILAFALSGLRDFRFLAAYIPAAVLQAALFSIRHDTVLMTVTNIWIVQGLLALALMWFLYRATVRPGRA